MNFAITIALATEQDKAKQSEDGKHENQLRR